MTLTLYQFPTSPFCEKIRRILSYKGVDFATFDVPRRSVGDFARVAEIGKFPAIDHDGQGVWDSTDVAHYLERTFPEPPLVPVDTRQRALCHVLEDWADESLYFYEVTMRISWEHNAREKTLEAFSAFEPVVPRDRLLSGMLSASRQITSVQGIGRKPQERVVADVRRHLEAADGFLAEGPFLLGSSLTLADLSVAVQFYALQFAREFRELLTAFPRVGQWLVRVDETAPDRGAAGPERGPNPTASALR